MNSKSSALERALQRALLGVSLGCILLKSNLRAAFLSEIDFGVEVKSRRAEKQKFWSGGL